VDEDETGNKKDGKATDYVDRHYMRELLTMGLLDHFRPPLSNRLHWHAFHNAWATYIASDTSVFSSIHLFRQSFTVTKYRF
jgi:hypothetical protein